MHDPTSLFPRDGLFRFVFARQKYREGSVFVCA